MIVSNKKLKEDLRNRVELNEGVRHLFEFHNNMSGSFYGKLLDAMMSADSYNLQKFKFSFPEEAEAVYRFKNEDDYWEKVKEAYHQWVVKDN